MDQRAAKLPHLTLQGNKILQVMMSRGLIEDQFPFLISDKSTERLVFFMGACKQGKICPTKPSFDISCRAVWAAILGKS